MTLRIAIPRTGVWWLALLALVFSVMMRSAGIALAGGLAAWLAVTWLTDRPAARRRLRTFLPLVVVAVVAQGAWMGWVATHEVVEWPIGGWPRSYVSQLGVKSGNRPELGPASLSDIPPRVARNLTEHTAGLMTLLTHLEYVNPVWFSPLILGPLLLIFVGLGISMWPGGGRVIEWYFVAHQAIYLLWPWDLELRFMVPIAPLAGLYLWRGGRRLVGWALREPRAAGAATVLVGLPAAGHAAFTAWRSGGVQVALSAVFWALLVAAATVVVLIGPDRRSAVAGRLRAALPGPLPLLRVAAVSVLGALCILVVTTEVGIGIAREARLGRENLAFDLTRRPSYPDVEAGRWIEAHTAGSAVVMARQVDVVYHYARRRVIWFPPISEPRTLMDGIRKHGVQFVIVSHRDVSYWLPPEEACFEALASAYPDSFRLVHTGPRFRVFAVALD
jgi:hypothetical protein